MSALLEARGMTVTYGGVHANDGIDLKVEQSQFVGLIGANGAGKTTFIDAITGFADVAAGSVRFAGEDITGTPPNERARRGLVRTFQSLELFEDLTVRDNLLVACEPDDWRSAFDLRNRRRRLREAEERAEWALATVGLEQLGDRRPEELPHGQRKLVGVARALAASPKLVLLDEPAAGLDAEESAALAGKLRGLLDHGVSALLIDHDMSLVLSVCDLVYVLDFGKVVAVGTPAEIRTNDAVIAAYLGESAQEAAGEPVVGGAGEGR